MKNTKCLLIALLAGLLLGPQGWAQDPPLKHHHWVVLVDVSLSSEGRDQQQSQRLGRSGYRLRNELLSLFQAVLVAKGEEDKHRRDHLTVFAFGNGVGAVTDAEPGSVRWRSIHAEEDWDARFPSGLGARTDLAEALRVGVEKLQSVPADYTKHLVILSDGELDVGANNRLPGQKMLLEELETYRQLLRNDARKMRWLGDHKVRVHTFAVDEDFTGGDDVERQGDIRGRLHAIGSPGDSALDRALSLVEDLNGKADAQGQLPFSEGPYVMQALADAFNGRSRSVRYENALQTLWDTFFPERPNLRVIPPGTRKLVAFAPRQEPSIPLQVDVDGVRRPYTLKYDAAQQSYAVHPADEISRTFEIRLQPTSQYVIWSIESPQYAIVELEAAQVARNLRVTPLPNVRLLWQEGHPKEHLVRGTSAELFLDLLLEEDLFDSEEWTLERWRGMLNDLGPDEKRAVVEIFRPDGSDGQTIELETQVPNNLTQVVLSSRGKYLETDLEGSYEVRARLEIGPRSQPDQNYVLLADPIHFRVLPPSILQAGRVSLHVRVYDDELGEATQLRPGESGDAAVEIEAQDDSLLVFEWRTDTVAECVEVRPLGLEIQPLDLTFGHAENDLAEPQIVDGQAICYRTVTKSYPEEFTVVARDDSSSWNRSVRIRQPPSLLSKISFFFAALVALCVLTVLAVPAFRRRALAEWNRRQQIKKIVFPIGVETAGQYHGWQAGKPKRLLLLQTTNGALHAEFSKDGPDQGEMGLELVPERARTYRLRPLNGPGWLFRTVAEDQPPPLPPMLPLSPSGELIDYDDLVEDTRFEVRFDEGPTATIRYADR